MSGVDKLLRERDRCIARIKDIERELSERGIFMQRTPRGGIRAPQNGVGSKILEHIKAYPGAHVADIAAAAYGAAGQRENAKVRSWIAIMAAKGLLRRESAGVWVPARVEAAK